MKTRKRFGAIPFRLEAEQWQFCLVSSAKNPRRFVLPKGVCKKHETACQAAARECFEEAGLVGAIARQEPIIWQTRRQRIAYYLLPVAGIEHDWPEQHLRQRVWVDAARLAAVDLRKRERSVLAAVLARADWPPA